MPGVLRVQGTIELDQFWPQGSSDADTTKVLVTVGAGSFRFAADGRRFRTTRVLEGARVRGASRDPVIDSRSRITVRLQGIDAPELHYRAAGLPRSRSDVSAAQRTAYNVANRAERRQHGAESATVALAQKLGGYGAGRIACWVESYVDHPYELVDTYGRVVGNLRVGPRYALDVNEWLTREGWAFPTFYSSMSEAEIQTLLQAARQGRRRGRIWAMLSDDTGRFDAGLVYRKGGPVDAAADRGAVILPKLFRRQVAWQMEKAAGITRSTFAAFLATRPDECYLTDEFLAHGVHCAPTRRLHEFMKGRRFTLEPQALVFREKPASVVDASGRRIEQF